MMRDIATEATPGSAFIIGAGVVGLSVGIQLLRRGYHVEIAEELTPASGASFGNSGFLVADTAMPIALPGVAWKIPGWLMDPMGPFAIKASYLPKATPWLLKFLSASNMPQVNRSSDALRELHKRTFELWRDLVGDAIMSKLVRRDGQVYVWEGPKASPTRGVEDGLRHRHGVEFNVLDASRLQQLYPGISRAVTIGLHIPGNGHTTNPGSLVNALTDLLLQAGGRIVQERVLKIWPDEHGGWTIMTNLSNRRTKTLVVAAGAWSARVLKEVGINVPLETERGYHVVLPDPSVELCMPILHKTALFGINSMEMGMRLSGTVEIAGLDSAPQQNRCQILVKQIQSLFPDMTFGDPVMWMGHRPSTPDSIPIIGAFAGRPGLFGCFGHGHAGLTGAPASAQLLAQLVNGETTAFNAAPYSPARFGV